MDATARRNTAAPGREPSKTCRRSVSAAPQPTREIASHLTAAACLCGHTTTAGLFCHVGSTIPTAASRLSHPPGPPLSARPIALAIKCTPRASRAAARGDWAGPAPEHRARTRRGARSGARSTEERVRRSARARARSVASRRRAGRLLPPPAPDAPPPISPLQRRCRPRRGRPRLVAGAAKALALAPAAVRRRQAPRQAPGRQCISMGRSRRR